jgi:hypothetical protein
MRFLVDCKEARRALTAVAPHASPDGEVTRFHRVVFEVRGEELTVSATNGYTVGHAVLSILDNEDSEIGRFDMLPSEVKSVLALFVPGKDEQSTLRFDVDAETTISDVGGLFEGTALTLPRLPADDAFPLVSAVIGSAVHTKPERTSRLVVDAKLLALFGKAAQAYTAPLHVYPAGDARLVVVAVGSDFVGLLMPIRLADDGQVEADKVRAEWRARYRRPASFELKDASVTITADDVRRLAMERAAEDDGGHG